MDFNVRRPSHLFALLLIILTFFLMVISPMITFFGPSPDVDAAEIENMSESARVIFEMIVLIIQLAMVFVMMVVFPIIWYLIVNKISFKGILLRLNLRFKGLDEAFVWAFITILIMFAISFIIGIISTIMGVADEETGNIQDIETYFSPVSMFLLLAIQPTFEEFLFRGFLLEKIRSFTGDYPAIILTGVLFGLAHLSAGKFYPAIVTGLLGVVLGFVVVRTKNLFTGILAHTGYNLIVYILYIISY